MSDTDWNEFTGRLVRRLGLMANGQHLVLIVRPFPPYDGPSVDPNHYVQLAWSDRDGLLAEAVSNRYLAGPAGLDERQKRRLLELGWNPPGTGSWGPNWDPSNYWRLWEQPASTREAASLAVVTLQEIYWAERSSDLVYRAGHPDGHRYSWPDLGLEPEREGAA